MNMSTPQNPSGAHSSGPVQPQQPAQQQPPAAQTQTGGSPDPTTAPSQPAAAPAQQPQSAPADTSSSQTAGQTTSTPADGSSGAGAGSTSAQAVSDRESSGAAVATGVGEPTQSGTTRVFMNTLTCESVDDDQIPFPVRQQLGNHMGLTDARSGNGIWDEVGDPSSGTGRGVSEVTYHLDSTDAPSEPVNAPGTPGSGAARAVGRPQSGNVTRTGGPGSEVHRQGDSSQITQQRTQEGRDDRIMAAAARGEQGQDVVAVLDQDDDSVVEGHTKVAGDPDHTLGTGASHQGSTSDEVPTGSTNDVLSWVGNDKSRARRALETENGKNQPRTTLVRQLNDKV